MGFRASENGNAASVSEDQYGRSSDVSCIRRGNVCRRDTITPCSEESERHPEKEVKKKKKRYPENVRCPKGARRKKLGGRQSKNMQGEVCLEPEEGYIA